MLSVEVLTSLMCPQSLFPRRVNYSSQRGKLTVIVPILVAIKGCIRKVGRRSVIIVCDGGWLLTQDILGDFNLWINHIVTLFY